MAPSVAQIIEDVPIVGKKDADAAAPEAAAPAPRVKRQIEVEGGKTDAKYPHYLPTWNHGQKYPPWEPFEHVEHGLNADPTFPDLLKEGTKIKKLTPSIGSEVRGVQLSSLSDAGKDQLALLVAQRKVVAFRDQDLADLPIPDALKFGGYFGRHHVHPTSGSPEGYPEVHIVHRYGKTGNEFDAFLANRTSSVSWHSDVSYEAQPPGTTFFRGIDFQVRVPWEPGTVVVWDNRVTAHSATADWFTGERRHLARITPQAERPYETPFDASAEAKKDGF
ncbi:hypothetical protein DH86_00000283 [Scytalidium sp. 3C]|nr:hypothetical protein DH86_00000283 [Scytalidium sp. 3C]